MKREIGIIGTCARAILGIWLVVSVVSGQVVRGPLRPFTWIFGLIIFPGVFLAWQWARARRNPSRLVATGPIASVINVAIFFYFLLFAPPSLSWLSDAVLLFYGLSMCLAAIRGYAGCEALAFSNWLLKRDDQVGCLFFSPIDYAERKAFHRAND